MSADAPADAGLDALARGRSRGAKWQPRNRREVGSDYFATTLAGDNPVYSFLCECFDVDCKETVGLTLRDYKRVRARPGRFLVLPGHIAEDEKSIEAHDGYWIIEKPPELLGRS